MLKNLKIKYKNFRDHFKRGPDWVDIPYFLNKKTKYQSPTLMILLWIYAYYIRVLTVPGRMLCSIIFLMFFYSMIFESPIRTFSMVLLAMLIVDIVVGYIFKPKIKIERSIPDRIRADSPIQINYTLTNKRNRPAFSLHIDPIHQQKWLKLEADISSSDGIGSNETITISSFLESHKRGEYILKPAFVSSSFPFGIFKWNSKNSLFQKILVYPKYEILHSLDLPVNSKFQKEGTSLVSNVGESMEFHACRDFRTGDNAKHIHWPSTARRGQLIVREFQEEFLCRIALIIDTYIPFLSNFFTLSPKTSFPELEAALSLTAAIAHHLAYGDYIVDVFAAGTNIYHFKSGRSLAQFDQILDILATIEPNHQHPISELEATVLEEIASIGSAMLIFLNWDKQRKKLVEQLQSHGVNLKIIFITKNSDKIIDGIPKNSRFFTPEEIFSGNIRNI
jgi:uncharacterized protein (DUF58 family)